MGRQVFTAGEILTAANMNDLGDATVMVFDDASARTTAIPTPVAGMVTYLVDTDSVEKFDGSNFVGVATPPAILQLVSATNSTSFSTTANTFQATGLEATITPTSTNSEVLILVSNSLRNSSASANIHSTIFRGTTAGTNLGDASTGMATTYNDSGIFAPVHLSFVDSPSATSAQTYTFAIRSTTSGQTGIAQHLNVVTSMTLMEVAG